MVWAGSRTTSSTSYLTGLTISTSAESPKAFERLSAYMNAFTREQATVYFALVPRSDAVAAAELMAGMLTRSTIGSAVYEKEKKVILEELAKDHASPDGLKEEKLRGVLWRGTPARTPGRWHCGVG